MDLRRKLKQPFSVIEQGTDMVYGGIVIREWEEITDNLTKEVRIEGRYYIQMSGGEKKSISHGTVKVVEDRNVLLRSRERDDHHQYGFSRRTQYK